MEDAKNAVVVYKGFKDFDEKVSVITDQGYFGFYKTKKDGTPTKAVESLKALAPQVGGRIDVLYKETVSNGKTYKNALAFYAPKLTYTTDSASKEKIDSLEKRIEELEARVQELENNKITEIEGIPF
jgi:hypothetical protein